MWQTKSQTFKQNDHSIKLRWCRVVVMRVNWLNVFMQPTGALQYLKYSTPRLSLTWQHKEQSYSTPALMDMFHQPHILCLLSATAWTGTLLNHLAVKVLQVFCSEICVCATSVVFRKFICHYDIMRTNICRTYRLAATLNTQQKPK